MMHYDRMVSHGEEHKMLREESPLGCISHHLASTSYSLVHQKGSASRKVTPASVPCYVHRSISNAVGHRRGAMQHQHMIGPSSWRTRALPRELRELCGPVSRCSCLAADRAPKTGNLLPCCPLVTHEAARHAVAHVHDTRSAVLHSSRTTTINVCTYSDLIQTLDCYSPIGDVTLSREIVHSHHSRLHISRPCSTVNLSLCVCNSICAGWWDSVLVSAGRCADWSILMPTARALVVVRTVFSSSPTPADYQA